MLSDPDKRKQYDEVGPNDFEDHQSRGNGRQGGPGFDFNDFFRGFDESLHHRRQARRGKKQKVKFGNGFFDFGSLWDDGDDDSMFADFGAFGDFGSAFGNGHHHVSIKDFEYFIWYLGNLRGSPKSCPRHCIQATR